MKKLKNILHKRKNIGLGIIVSISLVGLYFLFNTGDVAAEWWNENWTYRVRVPVTNNTTEETDVYIAFDAGTQYIDTSDTSKFQGDCGDLRFTNEGGNILPYYLVSGCGTASTEVHVFLETLAAGSQNIFYYYGNPSAQDGGEGSDFSTEASNYTIGTLASEEVGPGPAGYWRFNEGADNTCDGGEDVCDATVAGNDGTFGATTAAPSWQTEDMCVEGKCLHFDGGDHIALADAPFDYAADAFTLSAWVYRTSGGSVTRSVISKRQVGGGSGYALAVGNSGEVYCQTETSTALESSYTNTGLITENSGWTYVAAVRDGTSCRVYINGIDRTTTTVTHSNPDLNNNDLRIGTATDGSEAWIGRIDEAKVYPYARTADEIKSDYAARGDGEGASAVFGAQDNSYLSDGLIGYWPMDEGVDNTCEQAGYDACDESGNGNHVFKSGNTYGVGKFGQSISFDGGGYLKRDVTLLNNMRYIDTSSWSFWYKPTSSSGKYNLVTRYRGVNERIYKIYQNTDASIRINLSSDGTVSNEITVATPASVVTTDWNHVGVVVKNESFVKIFVNGVEQVSQDIDFGLYDEDQYHFNTYTDLVIGEDCCGNDPLNGSLDDLRIYNRELSPTEVSALYNWAPGPVAYYDFDENTGTSTVYDKSGNGNDGTMNGSMTESDWVRGKFGSALDFDGSDDEVANDNVATSYFLNSSGTMCAWVNSRQTTGDVYHIASFGDSGNFYNLGLTINYGTFQFRSATGSLVTSDAGSTVTNEWVHLCGTWDSSQIQVYRDGVLMDTASATVIASADRYTIGRLDNGSNGREWDGLIDDIKIYNYARTPGQIIEDMNGGHPIGGSPIGSQLAYWGFNEGYGDTAYDIRSDQDGDLAGSGTTCPTTGACPSWANGKLNKALNFDGTDDMVDLGDMNALDNTSLTITAWINLDSLASDEATVFSKWNDDDKRWTFRVATDGSVMFLKDQGGTDSCGASIPGICVQQTAANVISAGTDTWHHVTMIFDSSDNSVSFYVDGSLKPNSQYDESMSEGLSTGNDSVLIGHRGDNNDELDGKVDEVKVYSTALTQEEILIDMNANAAVDFGNTVDEKDDIIDGAGSDPIVYWNFNENSGSVANDVSGNGTTGTFQNTPDWVRGDSGSALYFSGVNESVTASVPSISTDAGSISLNFKTSNDFSGDDGMLFYSCDGVSCDNGFGTQNEMHLHVNNSNQLEFFIEGGVTDLLITSTETVNDDQWHHAEVTWDITGLAVLYLDGSEVDSATHDANSFTGDTERVGITYGNARDFVGSIDEVKIYDYQRSRAQVAYDYNRGAPVGWWKFNKCSGSTAHDYTGNGYDGTITASTGNSVGTCGGTAGDMWADGETGKFEASLSFDGSDDYVGSSTQLVTSYPFALSAWVKSSGNTNQDLFGIYDVSSGSDSFVIRADATTASLYACSGGCDSFSSTTDVTDGNWHHVVGVFASETDRKLYIDGVLENSDTDSKAFVSGIDTWSVGRGNNSTPARYLDGQIDDVRIYNYALSESQIRNIMNYGAVRFE